MARRTRHSRSAADFLDRTARRAAATATAPQPDAPIDIGIMMTMYGQDADGNFVEIGSSQPPAGGTPIAGRGWPTEQ